MTYDMLAVGCWGLFIVNIHLLISGVVSTKMKMLERSAHKQNQTIFPRDQLVYPPILHYGLPPSPTLPIRAHQPRLHMHVHVWVLYRIGYKSQCARFLYMAAKRCKSTFFRPVVHDVNNVLNWILDLSVPCVHIHVHTTYVNVTILYNAVGNVPILYKKCALGDNNAQQ